METELPKSREFIEEIVRKGIELKAQVERLLELGVFVTGEGTPVTMLSDVRDYLCWITLQALEDKNEAERLVKIFEDIENKLVNRVYEESLKYPRQAEHFASLLFTLSNLLSLKHLIVTQPFEKPEELTYECFLKSFKKTVALLKLMGFDAD